MRSKCAALLVMAGLVLGGCATTPSGENTSSVDLSPQHPRPVRGFKCTPGVCKVDVEPNFDSGGRPLCPVSVNPEILDVRMGGGPRRGQKVVFSLDPNQGFKFVDPRQPNASYPIRIKSGPDPFVPESATVSANGRKLELLLKERRSDNLLEYGLLVAHDEPTLRYCAEIDPWMVD